MFFLYNLLYSLAFLLMTPVFAVSALVRGRRAAGYFQRLGFLPSFEPDERPVVWVHCVSVGETNAARPLIEAIRADLPDRRIIVSTTTRTGQKLARELFADHADRVFYVPFDMRWCVRRALRRFRPSTLLLMESEIWFNLIRETSKFGARLAIVNGRLSERSYKRWGYFKRTVRRVLGYLDMALMQSTSDAKRIMALGLRASKVRVTGNLKYDHDVTAAESELTAEICERFGITPDAPLVVAASTHAPEEEWVIEAFRNVWKDSRGALPRLLIAPRHPERFDEVARQIRSSGFQWVRRTESPSGRDKNAEVILLDTIGELRSVFSLAEIVIVGGSFIPHGGQSIFEPAAAGRAIVTGPFMSNFEPAFSAFQAADAIVRLEGSDGPTIMNMLSAAVGELLNREKRREILGKNALRIMNENRGSTRRTIEQIEQLISTGRPVQSEAAYSSRQ